MSITHLKSLPQLNTILASSKTKVTVIDFHATWCGPCHAIAPTFEALAKQFPGINFLKCDVDAARDVASQYAVSAMPTFVFLKGSTKVDQIRGADKNALESTVRKHSTASDASSGPGVNAFSGKGQTLSGNSSSVRATATEAAGSLDPQLKVLFALVGAYALFWYLS